MLAGAVSFSAEHDYGAFAAKLCRASAFPGDATLEVSGGGGLWLHAFAPPREHVPPLAATQDDATSYLFAEALRLKAGLPAAAAVDPVGHDVPLRWIALTWDRAARRLSIITDRLGLLWLYVAALPGGLAFSTHFGALVRALPGTPVVDWDTTLLELAYGYSPDQRTVFEGVELPAPGATTEFSAAGRRVVRRRPVRYGDAGARLSENAKLARLDAIYSPILARYTASRADISVSLSAGLDSRYALAFLQRGLPDPPCCTFGDPGSDEVHGAERVAREAGVRTEVFDIPSGEWPQWTRAIHALGNAGMTQWSGWAEGWLGFLGARGRVPLIGFLGDALSGKHLGGQAHPADWVETWRAWSTDGGWAGNAIVSAAARARIAVVGEARLRECAAAADGPFPHQAGLHLDLFGRQRRWVASQPNLMSRYLTPLLFFYDQALIDFWASLPVEDLIGQRLYRAYARDRFPTLFHDRRQSPGLAQRALAKARRVVTASDRERPRVVDTRRFIEPNRAAILALVDRVRPLVEDRIDLDAFAREVRRAGADGALSGTLIARAVNVFLLLELALGTAA